MFVGRGKEGREKVLKVESCLDGGKVTEGKG